jgi:hypothetical protein
MMPVTPIPDKTSRLFSRTSSTDLILWTELGWLLPAIGEAVPLMQSYSYLQMSEAKWSSAIVPSEHVEAVLVKVSGAGGRIRG